MTSLQFTDVPKVMEDAFGNRHCPICRDATLSHNGGFSSDNGETICVIFNCADFHYELEVIFSSKDNSYIIDTETVIVYNEDHKYEICNYKYKGSEPRQKISLGHKDVSSSNLHILAVLSEPFPFDINNFNHEEFIDRLENLRLFQ